MIRLRPGQGWATSTLISLVLIASAAFAVEPINYPATLHLRTFGLVWGSACQPGPGIIVAGSAFDIKLTNSADRSREPLSRRWPQGYRLEACLDLLPDHPFDATPGLIERLTPTLHWTLDNRMNDWALKESGGTQANVKGLNTKTFMLSIPADLAGHTLTVRALYDKDTLRLQSESSTTLQVVAPCDQRDSARVLATWIFEAFDDLDGSRALQLADSMLAQGWCDPSGLSIARDVAVQMHAPEKALVYMDRLYQTYGVLVVPDGTVSPPLPNRGGPRTPELQQAYDRQRAELLEAITRQNQPQH